jgi:hypothetical protein
MKFIHDKIMHRPEALVGDMTNSTSKTIPVYKWTPGLKVEVLHKLSKLNSQSMDPLLQLTKVQQDVWDMAIQLGQPHGAKEGSSQVKPLLSITTFHHLTGLTDNKKLQLLTGLYSGKLTVPELEH